MTERSLLLLAGRLSAPRAGWVAEALTTDWDVRSWNEEEPFADFARQVVQAKALVAGRLEQRWPPVPDLKLYQLPFTGHHWIGPGDVPRGCRVCNTYEHEVPIAEYVLGAMLEREIGIHAADRGFRDLGWDGKTVGGGSGHGELYGKTLGIVGHGHIGGEVAHRAAAFGMRTIAVSRTPRPAPPPLHWLGVMADLDRLLGESDYVLIAVPLADETRGLIDAARLAAMKPGGVIINVGRGQVVDEGALYTALADSRIGGAVIDVWYDYPDAADPNPPPSKYPFHELDNIIMTPHFSAYTDAMRERRWTTIAANIDRLARGETLENVCFEGTGEVL